MGRRGTRVPVKMPRLLLTAAGPSWGRDKRGGGALQPAKSWSARPQGVSAWYAPVCLPMIPPRTAARSSRLRLLRPFVHVMDEVEVRRFRLRGSPRGGRRAAKPP